MIGTWTKQIIFTDTTPRCAQCGAYLPIDADYDICESCDPPEITEEERITWK